MDSCFDFTDNKNVEMSDGNIPAGVNTLLRQIEFHNDGVIVIVCEENSSTEVNVSMWVIEPAGKRLVTVDGGGAYVTDDNHDNLRIRRE